MTPIEEEQLRFEAWEKYCLGGRRESAQFHKGYWYFFQDYEQELINRWGLPHWSDFGNRDGRRMKRRQG